MRVTADLPSGGRRTGSTAHEHHEDQREHQGLRRRRADVAARGEQVVHPHADHLGAGSTAGEQVDVVELVEREDEPQHGQQRDGRQELGEHHVTEPLADRGPVHLRRLLQVAGQRLDAGGEEQEREREVPPRLERHHGQQGHRHRELDPEHGDVRRALRQERDGVVPAEARRVPIALTMPNCGLSIVCHTNVTATTGAT